VELPWRLPLVQAPIGPAATPELVAAVSRTGALGTLAASWTPAAVLREQVRALRAASDAPFCVNLVLAFEQRERLQIALEEGAPVLSFSWGVDPDLIRLTRDAGAFVLVQVGAFDEAVEAVRAGTDALIVQGVEAGGHVQATRALAELLREVVPAVRVPVVAAGGIADAAGVEATVEAGAAAAACGTVFLAAEEADVHPVYLDRLLAAGAADTTLTTAFDGGWPDAPHRVLRNDTVAAWEAAGRPASGRRPGENEAVGSRRGRPVLRYDDAQPTRDTVGDVGQMALYAGTSVRAIGRRRPAATIVEHLL
jgi:NAD(P)H-dependent flavin oxidoreductase YrpB (nitropropane dioxygenase family)